MGLVDMKDKQKVVNKLLESVRKTGYHIDTGILGAKFLLHALADNGHVETAYKIVTN